MGENLEKRDAVSGLGWDAGLRGLRQIKLGTKEKSEILGKIADKTASLSLPSSPSRPGLFREYRNLVANYLRKLLA